jgi:acetoin utilization deacetylase AcuC-like enzyme
MSSQYGGFCYLNNAAIAARALGGRGAILDIDYHHGNGTQEIFYANPDILFCSLHAHPDDDYPFFWGASEERGEGLGLGANCNWPLPLGCREAAYLAALDEALNTIAVFKPNWLVLSAGFDIGEGDPVGGFHITRQGFAEIGRRIACLGLPTVIVQEGGYLLEALGEFAVVLLSEFGSV